MMTATHDQAMNYVYQQMLQRLLGFFSRAERTALQLMIQPVSYTHLTLPTTPYV